MLLLLWAGIGGAPAAEPWETVLSQMPLRGQPEILNATNCVHLLLSSFKSNDVIKAFIFLPAATDELYLARRVNASLSRLEHPSLLDGLGALTNQTRLRATFCSPFLLVHLDGERLEARIEVRDPATAEKLKTFHFKSDQHFEDKEWDAVQPGLRWTLKLDLRPWRDSPDSWHFYRQNFAGFGLSGWEVLQAVALASKTKFTVDHKRVTFEMDVEPAGQPAGKAFQP